MTHYFQVRPANNQSGFIAFAKTEPFTQDDCNGATEPGDLWFAFGETPRQALEGAMADIYPQP